MKTGNKSYIEVKQHNFLQAELIKYIVRYKPSRDCWRKCSAYKGVPFIVMRGSSASFPLEKRKFTGERNNPVCYLSLRNARQNIPKRTIVLRSITSPQITTLRHNALGQRHTEPHPLCPQYIGLFQYSASASAGPTSPKNPGNSNEHAAASRLPASSG